MATRISNRFFLGALIGFALLAMHAPPVLSGVPDPTTSDCDTCVVISPEGSFVFHIVLRDDANAPVPGATVVVDFNGAVGINLCDASDPDQDGRVSGVTDAGGVLDLFIRGGGSATGTAVVSSQAQTLCFAHVRSTDLDGDGVVTALDETAHQALAVDALAGDYDCNGVTDAADLATLQSQLNENCLTVQNLPGTWGRLKAIYR